MEGWEAFANSLAVNPAVLTQQNRGRRSLTRGSTVAPHCTYFFDDVYYHPLDCGLQIWEGSNSLCILHDPDPNKDVDLFNETLEKKIQQIEKNPSIEEIILAGVVFPATNPLKDEASLRGMSFRKAVDFSSVKFRGFANFEGTQFGDRAVFSFTKFDRGVAFDKAEFVGRAVFDHTEFSSQAYFRGVRFAREAHFESVKFRGFAAFPSAEFEGNTDFSNADFGEDAQFVRSKFQSGGTFSGAQFRAGANFSYAVVGKTLEYRGTSFPPLHSDTEIEFHFLTFQAPQALRFEDVDLSRVSFIGTDLTQVHLVGCRWPSKTERRFWPVPLWSQQRLVVYDELILEERDVKGKMPKVTLPLVADLYRQLRINLEASRQEIEAGDFYIGQMEMRRRDTSYPLIYRLLLACYRAVADYGESYWKPFAWYALILTPLFALAYWALGTVAYANGFFSALTAGVLFREVPEGVVAWEKMLVYFNMIADIFLLGLTLVALRRRFRR